MGRRLKMAQRKKSCISNMAAIEVQMRQSISLLSFFFQGTVQKFEQVSVTKSNGRVFAICW